MENNTQNNSNWNTHDIGKDLPNASTSMALGIIGLIVSIILGCSPVGFVLSIIAFVKGKKAMKEYDNNPGMYTSSSYGQAKAGKITGLIGLILGLAVIALVIVFISIVGIATITGGN